MTKIYQAISIVFNPVVTLGVISILTLLLSFYNTPHFWKWLILGIGILYGIPGIYYSTLIVKNKTDFDVKDRPSREAIFKIRILTAACVLILSLFLKDTEILQKMLLAGIVDALIYLMVLNQLKFELSVHVGYLSSLTVFLVYYSSSYYLFGLSLIIVTALARYKLKKHTIAELIGGAVVSGGIYLLILSR